MGWISRVNWLDVVALVIVIRSIYIGSQRGLFGELFYIFGTYLTIVLSIHLYGPVSLFMSERLFMPARGADLTSFVVIWLAIYFVFRFIYRFLQGVIKAEVLSPVYKIGGVLLSFCRGVFVSTIFFLIMLLIPIGYVIDSVKTKSFFAPFLIKTGTTLYEKTFNTVSSVGAKDLTQFLSGAEPIEFEIFNLKRRSTVEEFYE